MQRIDILLDEALKRVKNGENISSVLSRCSNEEREQLRPLLEITTMLSALPRKEVPAPAKRRLYLEHQPRKSPIATFINSFRILSGVLASLVLLISATAFGAANSLPGNPLFNLKKGYEDLRVSLAASPQQRANLQLQYADQRLREAKQVLAQNNSENNSKDSRQALRELSEQTVDALNDVKVAVALSNNNSAIVQQAETLAKNQNSLLAKADPQNTQQAQQQAKTILNDIKRIYAAASETGTASLAPATTINTSGKIANVQADGIKVDGNFFQIGPTASIEDQNGNILSTSDLKTGQSVSVKGKIQGQNNIAQIIVVTIPKPVVKSDAAQTQAPPASTAATGEAASGTATQAAPAAIPAPAIPPIPVKPNDTFGGFIPEKP